jgi:hypothetical protein
MEEPSMKRAGILSVLLFLFSLALPICAAVSENARSIALVLDASGSMKARLPDGATRIEAAKAAVAEMIINLPAETRLALRAYGHQSPTQKKDCKDTALLVPFDTVANNKSAVLEASRGIQAQGYTPITYVLRLAAEDLARENAASRVVVLVSDGQETCESDPCAAAKALADADAKLVVHAIGLGVSAAARFQLQCIANVARGAYFDANNRGELARVLGEASAKAPTPMKTQITISRPQPGRLEVKGATQEGHRVIAAATGQRIDVTRPGTGQKVDSIHPLWPVVELPSGIYNVTFANGLWRGIEVKPGETTVIEPGILEIKNADFQGHKVLEPETGEIVAELLTSKTRVALIPSRFSVTFGKLIWPDVEIKPGRTTTLNPGVINVRTAVIAQYDVIGPEGQLAGKVGTGANRLALPAGDYILELPDQKLPINLQEGQVVEINIQ